MHLPPLALALNTMLAGLPFVTRQWFACKPREGAIAEELDAGAVHEQVDGSIRTAVRDLDGERLVPPAQRRVIRHGPVQTRHLRQASHHPGSLPERQLEQDLNRQAELERASQNTAGRPGLPSGGASQVIPLSNQISSDPRLRSAAV
jgi:hypothetical protein